MIQFYATLHMLGAHAMNYVGDQADAQRRVRDERGSITIEQVLWAVAIIGIATAVILVVRGYVMGEADKIK